jgi:hypothetical protein
MVKEKRSCPSLKRRLPAGSTPMVTVILAGMSKPNFSTATARAAETVRAIAWAYSWLMPV